MEGAVLGGVLGAGQWPQPRTSGAQAAGGPIHLRHHCKGRGGGAGRLPLRQGAEVGGPGEGSLFSCLGMVASRRGWRKVGRAQG